MRALPEPADVTRLIAEASALPSLAARRGQLERLAADYARSQPEVQRALVIAVVGATGAGKSTLVNALAGVDIAEEGVDRPTSRHAVVYAPDDALLEGLSGFPAKVARYRPRGGAPWAGQVFIDTPDLNSVAVEHREVTRAIAEVADVLVVLMHRSSVAEASQADFLADFARRRRLVFAVNFADQLGPAARDDLKAQVLRVAASRLGVDESDAPVFAISAAEAKRTAQPGGDWTAFVASLMALGERSAHERVRRSNAVAILREVEALVRPAADAARTLDDALAKALESGLGAAEETLRTGFEQRLALADAHLTSEVRRHASTRWWGPAAWWLRLSMLGAGGLGMAAVLARRSLPLGLAVGAATAGVEKLREGLRGRAADARVMSDDEADVGGSALQAARAALTPARALAHEAAVAPSVLGLPEADALAEAWAALRASSWRAASERGVAEATQRWWRWARWLLLPLVNGPLLVLFGHVTWEVGHAYLSRAWLGVDYFLTAGAMAVLLAVAGGVVASLTLAGTVAHARAVGLEDFRQALAAQHIAVLDGARAALAGPRAAARALLEASSMPEA